MFRFVWIIKLDLLGELGVCVSCDCSVVEKPSSPSGSARYSVEIVLATEPLEDPSDICFCVFL